MMDPKLLMGGFGSARGGRDRPGMLAGALPGQETRSAPKKKPRRRRIKVRSVMPIRPSYSALFVTDVTPVRKAIRAVYRNYTWTSFVAMVNFILRGMRLMQHSVDKIDKQTYWHTGDPTFISIMGNGCASVHSLYLLQQMGFVLVENHKWCWPRVHVFSFKLNKTKCNLKKIQFEKIN